MRRARSVFALFASQRKRVVTVSVCLLRFVFGLVYTANSPDPDVTDGRRLNSVLSPLCLVHFSHGVVELSMISSSAWVRSLDIHLPDAEFQLFRFGNT